MLRLPGPVLALDGFSLKASSLWRLSIPSLVGSDKSRMNSPSVPERLPAFIPSPSRPDLTSPFFIWKGWVLFMITQSWIASFFKNFFKMQNDSANYIRTDKENWAQFWLVSSSLLFWNFPPAFLTPFQIRNVHGPVCGKGPLRLPNIPRNPCPLALLEFLGRSGVVVAKTVIHCQ